MKLHRWIHQVLFLSALVTTGTLGWTQTPVPQNVLWRVNVDGTDRMTVVNALERDLFPVEGQMFYIPNCSAPGPGGPPFLFRLYNGPDHMDSTQPVSSYYTEWAEGCPFPLGTWLPGLQPMLEAFNPSTGDHALSFVGETIGGYTEQSGLKVMGYKRYLNEAERLLPIKGREISVDSNLVAGGNTWHWTWNGLQYLNVAGYPRGMHAEMFFEAAGGSGAAYEAGDAYSFFPDTPANIHGAPLVAAFNRANKQITLAVPLELDVDSWGGGINNPVVWQDLVFGKELTLNFHNDPAVARYRTYLYYPAPGNPAVGFNAPATYLRGLFTRYFTYDAVSDDLREISNQLVPCTPQSQLYRFAPTFGGLIVSNAVGSYAMGVYGADPSVGGTVNFMTLRPRICPELGGGWGNPESETSYSTVVLRAGYEGPITREITWFNTYFVTNTLEGVRVAMRRLYTRGAK